jgi:hypothetical protein
MRTYKEPEASKVNIAASGNNQLCNDGNKLHLAGCNRRDNNEKCLQPIDD